MRSSATLPLPFPTLPLPFRYPSATLSLYPFPVPFHCLALNLSREQTTIGRDISGDALFASQVRRNRGKPWVNLMLIP